jgi:hypothetical protein
LTFPPRICVFRRKFHVAQLHDKVVWQKIHCRMPGDECTRKSLISWRLLISSQIKLMLDNLIMFRMNFERPWLAFQNGVSVPGMCLKRITDFK